MNHIFINFIYNKEYYFIRRENINYYTSIYHDISITDLYNQDYEKIINTATKYDAIQFSLHGIIIFDFDKKMIFDFQYLCHINMIMIDNDINIRIIDIMKKLKILGKKNKNTILIHKLNLSILKLNQHTDHMLGNNIENVKYVLSLYDIDNYIDLKKFLNNFFHSNFFNKDGIIDETIRGHKLRIAKDII